MIEVMPDDVSRVPLPAVVLATRVVVMLPAVGVAELIAPVEVLIQEGLRAFSLPATGARPGELRAVFAARGCFGVHDVRDIAQARQAIAEGAEFASSLGAPQAVDLLVAAEVPTLVGALTPGEVARAWVDPVSAVQVVPAGVFGNSYAAHLVALLPDIALTTRGADSSYEARVWLAAGARAVFVADKLLGDSIGGGDLAGLRLRARPYLEAALTGDNETLRHESAQSV